MFKKIAALAFVAAMTPVAFAGAEAGDSEASVSGNITSTDAFDMTQLYFSYGYYFTDAIKVNFTLGLTDAGGSDTTVYGIGGEWNFGGEDVVPFLFANFVSYDAGGFSETGYGIGAGARFYMSENAGFRVDVSQNTVGDFDVMFANMGLFYNF